MYLSTELEGAIAQTVGWPRRYTIVVLLALALSFMRSEERESRRIIGLVEAEPGCPSLVDPSSLAAHGLAGKGSAGPRRALHRCRGSKTCPRTSHGKQRKRGFARGCQLSLLSAINTGNTGANRPHQTKISIAGGYTSMGRVKYRSALLNSRREIGEQAMIANGHVNARRAPRFRPSLTRRKPHECHSIRHDCQHASD